MCNPTTDLRVVSEMLHCNLSGAVMLVLEKLRVQTRKERKTNSRSLQPDKCPVGRTIIGHSPRRTGYNHRKVNLKIMVGKGTLRYAFVRVLLCVLLDIIPSLFNAHSYIPEVM